MKKIANGSVTDAGTFQGNVNQVNGGRHLQKRIQNPIKHLKGSVLKNSQEQSTPKSGYYFISAKVSIRDAFQGSEHTSDLS